MSNVLGPESWEEIRAAYVRGKSARALGLRWGVSTSAIYRRAVSEGWAKRRSEVTEPRNVEISPFAPAHRRDAPDEEEELPDLLGDVLTGEIHEPGFLARIAIGASGDALRNYEFDDARKLIRLANEYARVADRCARPNLHTILRALTDRVYADALFEVEDGERNAVKDIYWTTMAKLDAMTKAEAPDDA